MRVISGKLKGRRIEGFNIPGTRPTMDRVKESIFSMIQNNILDSSVLDLFAGSGNYGIEAISNGAKIVYFNDYNIKCVKTIKDNLVNMNILDYSKITNLDYKKALKYFSESNIKFNLVFLDPPYKKHIINDILDNLINNDLLNPNALVICEMSEKEDYINNNAILYKEKKYGDKIVLIYKFNN